MSVPSPQSIVTCPTCAVQNPSDRRFCRGCGGELQDECPQCRFEITIADSFCSGCGYNVDEHYAAQVRDIETRLQHVEELVVESKFDEAISVLALLSRFTHQRVKSAAKHVEQLYSIVREKRDQKVKEVLALCDSAKLYATTGLISSAIAEFERVPRNMLPPKAKAMLDELKFKQTSSDSLKSGIRKLVAEKKILGLLPRIANLLSLSPAEDEYRELGKKVSVRLIAEIKKLIVQSKYQKAYEVARELVPPFESDESKKLKSTLCDRYAIDYQIKNQYLADRTLLELIHKFRKLDPNNSEMVPIETDVKKLVAAKSAEQRVNVRIRNKSNDSIIAGIQPWQLAGISSIRFSKPELADLSVSFMDCLGLGLQAIGEVPLQQSFSESKSTSLLSMFASRKVKEAWGVVIEGTTLRAIRISASKDASDARPVVDHVLTIPYSGNESVDGQLRLCQQSLVSKLYQRVKEAPGEIALGLSPRKVLPRFFSLPPADQKKLLAAIDIELQRQSPFGKDEIVKRFETLQDGNPSGARSIMGTIVRKSDLNDCEDVCKAIGIKPFLVQSTPQAIFNLLNREWFENEHKLTKNEQSIACLDIGEELSVYLVAGRRQFWWRYIPLGKKDITTSIARHLKLTLEQANKVVEHPALASRFDKFLEACIEFNEKLISELLRSQNQAEQFMNGIKSPNLLLAGESIPYLIDSIKFGTEKLLPWSGMIVDSAVSPNTEREILDDDEEAIG